MFAKRLLLHGTADDWVPIAPCREYVAPLTKAGMNVRLIEYADAYHVFAGPRLREQLDAVLTRLAVAKRHRLERAILQRLNIAGIFRGNR